MSKRERDINGNYIGNAIGVCHCDRHPGALNRQIAYKHKYLAKSANIQRSTMKKAGEKGEKGDKGHTDERGEKGETKTFTITINF